MYIIDIIICSLYTFLKHILCVCEIVLFQESASDQNRETQPSLPVVRSVAKCAYGALNVLDFVSRLKQVQSPVCDSESLICDVIIYTETFVIHSCTCT